MLGEATRTMDECSQAVGHYIVFQTLPTVPKLPLLPRFAQPMTTITRSLPWFIRNLGVSLVGEVLSFYICHDGC